MPRSRRCRWAARPRAPWQRGRRSLDIFLQAIHVYAQANVERLKAANVGTDAAGIMTLVKAEFAELADEALLDLVEQARDDQTRFEREMKAAEKKRISAAKAAADDEDDDDDEDDEDEDEPESEDESDGYDGEAAASDEYPTDAVLGKAVKAEMKGRELSELSKKKVRAAVQARFEKHDLSSKKVSASRSGERTSRVRLLTSIPAGDTQRLHSGPGGQDVGLKP